MDLQGKNAFVTGGSIGIGKEVVIDLARNGANVAFTYVLRTSLSFIFTIVIFY